MARRFTAIALTVAIALVALNACVASNPPPPTQPPIRAAFYYPWYPGAWTQNGGQFPYTNYTPSRGFYNSRNLATVQGHISDMQFAGIQAGIASWWGQGSYTDGTIPTLLQAAQSFPNFRWTLYYEPEGNGDPTVQQIANDLDYIRTHYASSPAYLHVSGKPVIFVYNADNIDCSVVDRWNQANLSEHFYLQMKVFPGYRNCATQPDSWHQYEGNNYEDNQAPYSFTVSPGFWKINESTPRLARNDAAFTKAVQDQVASKAAWQLTVTYNEWGEGTQVEPSTQLGSAALNILATNGVPPSTTTTTTIPNTTTTTIPSTTTTLPTTTTTRPTGGPCGNVATPPSHYSHVVWVWMENHTYSQVIGNSAAPYESSLARSCATWTNYKIVGSPSLPNYIGATAGQTFGISDDSPPSSHVLTADNVFRQVRSTGGTAHSYEEGIPSNCAVSGGTRYAVKHNPAAYYTGADDHSACLRDDLPLSAFDANNLSTFSFVTPNLCNDTHDCSVNTGDQFLSRFIPNIVNSTAYRNGEVALVIVHDEYTPIPNVIMSESVRPTSSSTSTSHYGLLRTAEDLLGLPCLSNACGAGSLRGTSNL